MGPEAPSVPSPHTSQRRLHPSVHLHLTSIQQYFDSNSSLKPTEPRHKRPDNTTVKVKSFYFISRKDEERILSLFFFSLHIIIFFFISLGGLFFFFLFITKKRDEGTHSFQTSKISRHLEGRDRRGACVRPVSALWLFGNK